MFEWKKPNIIFLPFWKLLTKVNICFQNLLLSKVDIYVLQISYFLFEWFYAKKKDNRIIDPFDQRNSEKRSNK